MVGSLRSTHPTPKTDRPCGKGVAVLLRGAIWYNHQIREQETVDGPTPLYRIEVKGFPTRLVAVWALIDLIGAMAAHSHASDVIEALWGGALLGQLGVLTVWAVFGTQRLHVRWPLAIVGATLVWTFGFFLLVADEGQRHGGPGTPNYDALRETLCLVPIVFLAAQLPLWILKGIVGSRVARDAAGNLVATAPSRQFGILHLLGVTTVFAVAMGLASVTLSHLSDTPGNGDPTLIERDRWVTCSPFAWRLP